MRVSLCFSRVSLVSGGLCVVSLFFPIDSPCRFEQPVSNYPQDDPTHVMFTSPSESKAAYRPLWNHFFGNPSSLALILYQAIFRNLYSNYLIDVGSILSW